MNCMNYTVMNVLAGRSTSRSSVSATTISDGVIDFLYLERR